MIANTAGNTPVQLFIPRVVPIVGTNVAILIVITYLFKPSIDNGSVCPHTRSRSSSYEHSFPNTFVESNNISSK